VKERRKLAGKKMGIFLVSIVRAERRRKEKLEDGKIRRRENGKQKVWLVTFNVVVIVKIVRKLGWRDRKREGCLEGKKTVLVEGQG